MIMFIDTNNLINTATSLTNKLNEMSDAIFKAEDALRKSHVNFTYQMPIKDMILSWERDDTSPNGQFRFFLTNMKDDKIIFRKPLMQTKLQEKCEFAPYLNEFFKKFESYLKEVSDNVK